MMNWWKKLATTAKAQRNFEKVTRLGADSENEWIRKSASIPGWLFEGEHEFLWDSAMNAPEGGVFLEIGSLYGKSACLLAGVAITRARGEKLFCVDPFSRAGLQMKHPIRMVSEQSRWSFKHFINFAEANGFFNAIVPMATLSTIALPALPIRLSLVFLDARHTEEGTWEDFTLVHDKILPGSRLIFHDAAKGPYDGVMRAVERALADQPSVWTLIKGRAVSFWVKAEGEQGSRGSRGGFSTNTRDFNHIYRTVIWLSNRNF